MELKTKKYNLCVFIIIPIIICCVFCINGKVFYPLAAEKTGLIADKTETDTNTRVLSVIMYHQILKKSRKSPYIITPDCFECDLKEIAARGYQTVLPCEVIDFVYNAKPLPNKPLMITFDDGHYNNMYYGVPLLKKYGMKAVFNIVGKYSENTVNSGDISKPAYSHLTWEELKKIADDKSFELGNHTYNLHDQKQRIGIAQKRGESRDQYKRVLLDDVSKMQEIFKKNCGVIPDCFAYPFGKYSKTSRELLIEYGFKMIFTCTEKNTEITRGDKTCLYNICRFNRSSNLNRKEFFENLEK